MKTLFLTCAFFFSIAIGSIPASFASDSETANVLEIPGYAPLQLQSLAEYLEAHSKYKISDIQGYEPVIGHAEEYFQPQTLSRNVTFEANGPAGHLSVICKLYIYLDPTDPDSFGQADIADCLTRGWHYLLPDESFAHRISLGELSAK